MEVHRVRVRQPHRGRPGWSALKSVAAYLGLVLVLGLYRFYTYFLRAKWGRPGRDIDKERRGPVPPPTALVDGDSGGSEGEADAGGPPADPPDPQDDESERKNNKPGDVMDKDGYSSLVSTEAHQKHV